MTTNNSCNFGTGLSGQVLTSNGNGSNPTFQAISFAGLVTTLDGDTGSASPSAGVITLNANSNAGSTVSFNAASHTVDLIVSDLNHNTLMGEGSGNISQAGAFCTAFGYQSLKSLTSGGTCTCIGANAGSAITSNSGNTLIGSSAGQSLIGSNNTAIGVAALADMIGSSASYNVAIGYQSGELYSNNETGNILINNQGITGESNVCRIGASTGSTDADLSTVYFAGINGNTVSNQVMVTINSSTDQLGVVTEIPIGNGGTNAASFTQSNGIVAYNGTSLVNYAGPQLSTAGVMTNTSQPAFLAYLSTNDNDATGEVATYTLGGGHALTIAFDNTSSMNTNGTFTAPKTGIYCFYTNIYVGNFSGPMTNGNLNLVTTSQVYRLLTYNPTAVVNVGNGNTSNALSVIVKMTSGDTAIVQLSIAGGAGDTATVGGAASPLITYFGGYLVC